MGIWPISFVVDITGFKAMVITFRFQSSQHDGVISYFWAVVGMMVYVHTFVCRMDYVVVQIKWILICCTGLKKVTSGDNFNKLLVIFKAGGVL